MQHRIQNFDNLNSINIYTTPCEIEIRRCSNNNEFILRRSGRREISKLEIKGKKISDNYEFILSRKQPVRKITCRRHMEEKPLFMRKR